MAVSECHADIKLGFWVCRELWWHNYVTIWCHNTINNTLTVCRQKYPNESSQYRHSSKLTNGLLLRLSFILNTCTHTSHLYLHFSLSRITHLQRFSPRQVFPHFPLLPTLTCTAIYILWTYISANLGSRSYLITELCMFFQTARKVRVKILCNCEGIPNYLDTQVCSKNWANLIHRSTIFPKSCP